MDNEIILDKLKTLMRPDLYMIVAEEFEGMQFYLPKEQSKGIKQEEIIKLHVSGKTRKEIADTVKVNYRYVNRVLNKYEYDKPIIDLYKQGKTKAEIIEISKKRPLIVALAIEDWKRNNRSNRKHLKMLQDFIKDDLYQKILEQFKGAHFRFPKKRLRVTEVVKSLCDDDLDFETIFVRVCDIFCQRKRRKDTSNAGNHTFSRRYIRYLVAKYKQAKEVAYNLRDGSLL